MKLLEENIGEMLQDISLGKYFLDKTSKAQETRAKIDKRNYIKLKGFHAAKEIISRMKRQPTEWEKIFANYPFDKDLITRYIKSSAQ